MKNKPNKKLIAPPFCPYCAKPSKLVTGAVIYPHRPDLSSLHFYLCAECDAYVGCHGNTTTPLGRLANEELRRAKKMVHAVFDPIWQKRLEEKSKTNPNYKKVHARGGRYKKLAEALGIPSAECHIGMFDVPTCFAAIAVCKSGVLSQ